MGRHTTIANRFLPLLDAEQDELEKEVNNRLKTWDDSQLKRAGYCLTSMSAFWLKRKKTDRSIARFTFGIGMKPRKHAFQCVHILCVQLPLTGQANPGMVIKSL